MNAAHPQPSILWRQVWGLAAVLAAVTLSWMAYGFYQPKILKDLGFVELAAWLGILQGFMGAVLEPLVGGISDRVQHRLGSRMPMITAGVTVAGLIFVGVALLLQWNIPVSLRWIIPALMTLWVMSMIVFRGPVIALLRQSAPLTALPQANVILTVVFGLVGALGPLMSMALNTLGASMTFILGGIALMAAATILCAGAPAKNLFPVSNATQPRVSVQTMALVFGIGLGSGLEVNLLLRSFPLSLQAQLSGFSTDWITAGILLISALVAVPMGSLTLKIGERRSMLGGLVAIAICLGLLLLKPNFILSISLFGIAGTAFGLVFESQIPFALNAVPASRAGLGTGLYFGGMGASTAILSLLLAQWKTLNPTNGFLLSSISLAIAILCITAIYRQRKRES
jgi:MFS family permease